MWLGIGGAWFETEHTAFGIEFGSGFGERLDWFDEAVELMKNMLPGGPASARGRFYHAKDVAEQPAARAGAPADPDRRQRRAEDAAHGRQVRRRLEHRRRPRARQAQGRGAPPLVRRGRPRPHGDRAHARGRRPDHPRHRGGGEEGRRGDEGAQHGLARARRTARSARPSWSPRSGRRSSTSASSTSTSTARRRSTTRRSSGSPPRSSRCSRAAEPLLQLRPTAARSRRARSRSRRARSSPRPRARPPTRISCSRSKLFVPIREQRVRTSTSSPSAELRAEVDLDAREDEPNRAGRAPRAAPARGNVE